MESSNEIAHNGSGITETNGNGTRMLEEPTLVNNQVRDNRSNPVPGPSGNPVPGSSGNPVPVSSGNPVPGSSGNPVPVSSGNVGSGPSANPGSASSGNPGSGTGHSRHQSAMGREISLPRSRREVRARSLMGTMMNMVAWYARRLVRRNNRESARGYWNIPNYRSRREAERAVINAIMSYYLDKWDEITRQQRRNQRR